MRRESKWTRVYGGAALPEPWYIRLTPDFMNLEATGFGHGLSISGNTFATKEAAEKAADLYDRFFEAMRDAIIEDHEEAKHARPSAAEIYEAQQEDEHERMIHTLTHEPSAEARAFYESLKR